MRLEELQKLARALIGKSEDDSVLDPVFRRILRDAPEERKGTPRRQLWVKRSLGA